MPIPRNSSGILLFQLEIRTPGGHLPGDPPGRETTRTTATPRRRASVAEGIRSKRDTHRGAPTGRHRHLTLAPRPPKGGLAPSEEAVTTPRADPGGQKGAAGGCYAPAIFDR